MIQNKDEDYFSGYSPTRIHIEFSHRYKCLSKIDKQGEDSPIYYRKKWTEKDFLENSEFEKIFTPDRLPGIHVSYDNIRFAEIKKSKKAEFPLEYEMNLIDVPTSNLLKNIKSAFDSVGFDPETVDENDKTFAENIPKDPSEYCGPDTPPIDFENLSEN